MGAGGMLTHLVFATAPQEKGYTLMHIAALAGSASLCRALAAVGVPLEENDKVRACFAFTNRSACVASACTDPPPRLSLPL